MLAEDALEFCVLVAVLEADDFAVRQCVEDFEGDLAECFDVFSAGEVDVCFLWCGVGCGLRRALGGVVIAEEFADFGEESFAREC